MSEVKGARPSHFLHVPLPPPRLHAAPFRHHRAPCENPCPRKVRLLGSTCADCPVISASKQPSRSRPGSAGIVQRHAPILLWIRQDHAAVPGRGLSGKLPDPRASGRPVDQQLEGVASDKKMSAWRPAAHGENICQSPLQPGCQAQCGPICYASMNILHTHARASQKLTLGLCMHATKQIT